jgi:hypothetical protein
VIGVRECGQQRCNFKDDGYINNLATDKTYHKVEAVWAVGATVADTHTEKFQVLGDYRHSQYNTPDETGTDCNSGGNTTSYITTQSATTGLSQCFLNGAQWFTVNMADSFRRRVNVNGSGISTVHGFIQRDFFCPNTPNAPPNTFAYTFRQVPVIKGACANSTLSDSTVAVLPTNQDLSCGDQVYIVGVGTKMVTDYCSVCTLTQLDNYNSTDHTCTVFSDLRASAKTIKLLN